MTDRVFCHLGHFLPFANNPKNQNFEKMKKNLEILSFYTWVPQTTSYEICFLRYGVQQTIFLSFWAITLLMTQKLKFAKNIKKSWRYYLFTHVYHKLRSYDGWFLRYKVQCNRVFFFILGHFLLFDSPNNPKNQNFEKNFKKPGDVIILHLRITNDNHKMYEIWSVTNRIFCLFAPFSPFSPTNNPKNQNFDKTKKIYGDIIFLNLCTTNDNHVIRDSSDMGLAERIFCHFELFFALLPS